MGLVTTLFVDIIETSVFPNAILFLMMGEVKQ